MGKFTFLTVIGTIELCSRHYTSR